MLERQEINADSASVETRSVVSQNRVTPEELTQALAQIESRKQEEAKRLAGTISINEAVAELNLDATPEEIWTEVQKQRAQAAPPRPAPVSTPPQTATLPLEATVFPKAQMSQTWNQRRQRRRRPGFTLALLGIIFLGFHSASHPHTYVISAKPAPAVMRSLTTIPDGQEVYADTNTLIQIAKGQPLSQIKVGESQNGNNRWVLHKTNGHVYLRAFTLAADSPEALQGHSVNVYNDDNSGELYHNGTSILTLRVDRVPMGVSGGDSDYSEITIPNFQPDPFTTLSPGS